MAKRQNKRMEKSFVFNWRILLFVFAFILLFVRSIHLICSGDRTIGTVLLAVSGFIALGVFLSPLYYSLQRIK